MLQGVEVVVRLGQVEHGPQGEHFLGNDQAREGFVLGGDMEREGAAFAFQGEEHGILADVIGGGIGREAVDVEFFLAEGAYNAYTHEVGHVRGGKGKDNVAGLGRGFIFGMAQTGGRVFETAVEQHGADQGGDERHKNDDAEDVLADGAGGQADTGDNEGDFGARQHAHADAEGAVAVEAAEEGG